MAFRFKRELGANSKNLDGNLKVLEGNEILEVKVKTFHLLPQTRTKRKKIKLIKKRKKNHKVLFLLQFVGPMQWPNTKKKNTIFN